MNIKSIIKYAKRLVVVAASIILFVSFVEILRIYNTLNATNPYFGYMLLLFVGAGCIYIIYLIIKIYLFQKRSLTAPIDKLTPGLSQQKLTEYYNYLMRYFERIRDNNRLPKSTIKLLQSKYNEYKLNHQNISYQLLKKMEDECLNPVLAECDKAADEAITATVRDVFMGVMISPYSAIDSFIVILRSIHLVWSIINIYKARPSLKESYSLIKNIALGIFSLAVLNFAEKPIEYAVGQIIPIFKNFSGNILQGVTAGYYIYLAAIVAKNKCRGYDLDNIDVRKYHQVIIDIAKSVPATIFNKAKEKVTEMVSIPNFIKIYIEECWVDYAKQYHNIDKNIALQNFEYIINNNLDKMNSAFHNIIYIRYSIKHNDNNTLLFSIYEINNNTPEKVEYKLNNIEWEELSSDIREVFIVEDKKEAVFELYKKIKKAG